MGVDKLRAYNEVARMTKQKDIHSPLKSTVGCIMLSAIVDFCRHSTVGMHSAAVGYSRLFCRGG